MSQPPDWITTQQQETLVHIITILNVTRYTMQVNRQHINTIMEAIGRTHNDITTLFNITSLIDTHINYQQILLHVCSILVNLKDYLYYMRQKTMHAMDYIDVATTGILSPDILPVKIYEKYWYILRRNYHQPCTYQFHQMKPFISIDTFIPMFWLQKNHSFS